MTNAEKFQLVFNRYATEIWALPEKDFLEWLNKHEEVKTDEIGTTKKSMAKQLKSEGIMWHEEDGRRNKND